MWISFSSIFIFQKKGTKSLIFPLKFNFNHIRSFCVCWWKGRTYQKPKKILQFNIEQYVSYSVSQSRQHEFQLKLNITNLTDKQNKSIETKI